MNDTAKVTSKHGLTVDWDYDACPENPPTIVIAAAEGGQIELTECVHTGKLLAYDRDIEDWVPIAAILGNG